MGQYHASNMDVQEQEGGNGLVTPLKYSLADFIAEEFTSFSNEELERRMKTSWHISVARDLVVSKEKGNSTQLRTTKFEHESSKVISAHC